MAAHAPQNHRKRTQSRRLRWAVRGALVLLLAVFLANVSKPGGEIQGCFSGCASPRQDPHPIRIATLNMLHGYPDFAFLPQRLALIAEEIVRLDVDIVLLQEVPWTPQTGYAAQSLAQITGMNYVYLRANGNRRAIFFEEGEAILSRYPLQDPGFTELQPQAWLFEHRVVLHATAVTPQGDLGIFVTHLTHRDADSNLDQALFLRGVVSRQTQSPAVIGGDFNALQDSPQMAALAQSWVDTYRLLHPRDPGATCCISKLDGSATENFEKRIDYLFFPRRQNLKILSARIIFDQPFDTPQGALWASDHAGLLIEVQIEE